MEEEEKAARMTFQAPCQIMLAGSTMCGKTTFIKNLLKHVDTIISPSPDRIVLCYGEYQPAYEEMKRDTPRNIEFIQGLPPTDEETFWDKRINNFLILDDLAQACYDNPRVSALFTVGSHHKNLSVAFLTQNLFGQGREGRNISLNCSYFVLFKNPRDMSQIGHFSRQVFPNKSKKLKTAYEMATRQPHSYLLVDLKQNIDDALRLRTNVLPCEGPMVVFYEE